MDSSTLVHTLASRRDDVTGVVSNLNSTFGALGSQQAALAESIERLPPFLRRANTTFVDLRVALDDVDPLVAAAKPVARRLGPFLDQARLFARDAEPTIRDLSRTIQAPGSANDLIELINSYPPLARVALDTRRVNGAERRGAFPETSAALRAAAPTIAIGRPYTPDFVGWLDDFSTTGGYDALGGYSRAWINLSELLYGPGPKLRQFRRCPGANEMPAADGSNVLIRRRGGRARLRPEPEAGGPVKRVGAALVAVAVVLAVALGLGAADDDGAKGKTYEIVLDNAFGLANGGDFKIAGVRAGTTGEATARRPGPPARPWWRPTSPSRGSPTSAPTRAARSGRSRSSASTSSTASPGRHRKGCPTAAGCPSSRRARRSGSTWSTTSCAGPIATGCA